MPKYIMTYHQKVFLVLYQLTIWLGAPSNLLKTNKRLQSLVIITCFTKERRFSKMSVLVSNVIKQVGVSLLRNSEFKMQGIEGESSKEQSAGETTTLGSDLSPTVLETVGKVEREQWDQGEESEESEGRDCNCSVPFIVGDSLSPVSSFSVIW